MERLINFGIKTAVANTTEILLSRERRVLWPPIGVRGVSHSTHF